MWGCKWIGAYHETRSTTNVHMCIPICTRRGKKTKNSYCLCVNSFRLFGLAVTLYYGKVEIENNTESFFFHMLNMFVYTYLDIGVNGIVESIIDNLIKNINRHYRVKKRNI